MTDVTVLVALETRFVRGRDGRVHSTTGVDGHGFWRRYLDAFDRVVVAARTGDATSVAELPPVEGPGVEVSPLPDYSGPWAYVATRAALQRAMRAAIDDADVLCLRAPGPIAGCAWRLRGDRPFGVEVVGDPLEALARGGVRSFARPLARLSLARDLRAMCRGAVAASYVTADVLQRRYPPGRWSTGASDIDLHEDAFARREDVERRPRRSGPFHLVFVGSLAQLYKGQDALINAVARCHAHACDVRLTIVGDGRCRARLEALAAAEGVRAFVRFTGHLDGRGVRDTLDTADLFVLPSRAEGLPRAMLEAMARGVPCLGSRVGGVPELLPADRLVPPGDAAALAAAIERVAHGDLLPLALRDLAVARRYHVDVLRRRRREFYERLRTAAGDRSTASFRPRAVGEMSA